MRYRKTRLFGFLLAAVLAVQIFHPAVTALARPLMAAPLLTAEATDGRQQTFRLTLRGFTDMNVSVWFEVWSVQDGPQALMRYPARPAEDGYTAFSNTRIHQTAGEYCAAAFAGEIGNSRKLAETTYTVDGPENGSVRLVSDPQTGGFFCTARAQAAAGITAMQAAVWHDSGQRDIRWVDLIPNDGHWESPLLNVRDFGSFGLYTVHVYARLENGVFALCAASQTEIAPCNYMDVQRISQGLYRLEIRGPASAENLQAAIWSAQDGQDDLVWYPAQPEDTDCWYVDIPVRNHNDPGMFCIHLYDGLTLLGAAAFTAPPEDLLSEAQARIATRCRSVYAEAGTDLHDCYLWVVKNIEYMRRTVHLTPPAGYTREEWYAVEGLEQRCGNCYTFSSAFCQLARGLGYDARYVEGEAYGIRGRYEPHGFVMVAVGGTWYICDPELEHVSKTGRNLYMQTLDRTLVRYRW